MEDVFSAMHLGMGGGAVAMATFGTSLSTHQLDLMLRSSAQEVVLLWDPDATRQHTGSCKRTPCPDCRRVKKTWELAERLAQFWEVRVPLLPDGHDPDDLPASDVFALIEGTAPISGSAAFRSRVLARLA